MGNFLYLFMALALSGCVSGTFGNHQDIEDFPLRAATKEEGKSLKRCLKTAYRVQMEHKKKIGKFYSRASEMRVDDACQGFRLALKGTDEDLEIMAQFSENESTVRWTINGEGVIEELLEPENDLDLDF